MDRSTLLAALLAATVLATGLRLDHKEEAEARAFMAECRKTHTNRECLVLWKGDTDVFEGEAM